MLTIGLSGETMSNKQYSPESRDEADPCPCGSGKKHKKGGLAKHGF